MNGQSLLCSGPDALTADWMQKALTAGNVLGTEHVEAVSVKRLGLATNAFGNLFRCRLTIKGGSPNIPETAIVKLPSTNRTAIRAAKWLSLHQREYDFYRILARHAQIRSPTLYYGEFDARTHQSLLLIEDLQGMESISQTKGVGSRQALLAVREIAKLHGQFWDAVDQPPVKGLFDTFAPGYTRKLQTAYLACLPIVFDRFDAHFSPFSGRFAETLGTRYVSHFGNLAAGPKTFVHGDFRSENCFFDNKGDVFTAIDWQGSGIGSGLYDVAYFLATSVTIENRRRIECSALKEYHAIVCRLGAKEFSFEDCWRGYRQNMLTAFMSCILGCGGAKLDDRRQVELATELMRRILAALEDLDAYEFLPGRDRFGSSSHGFSVLSRSGYRIYRFARRLGGKASA